MTDDLNHSPQWTSQRGFTLLEVLVAVAILAIALGAIMASAVRFANNADYLRAKTVAGWVANNRLAIDTLTLGWPAPGRSNGEVDMGNKHWFWDVKVSNTQDPWMRRLDVSVRLDKNGPALAQLTGFLARPAGTH